MTADNDDSLRCVPGCCRGEVPIAELRDVVGGTAGIVPSGYSLSSNDV